MTAGRASTEALDLLTLGETMALLVADEPARAGQPLHESTRRCRHQRRDRHGAPREVMATVGAGDGFAVGMLSARLEGRPWRDAAARANWMAARAIQVIGDMDRLPRRSELPTGL
jgi:sugar/nucleoside kinase (ribokinase family)